MDTTQFTAALEEFLASDVLGKMLLSVAAVTLILVVRVIVDRAVVRRVKKANLRRRWRASVRTAATLILLLAIVAIWAERLSEFAVSIVAVAVATVIATKDLIECIAGSLLRLTSDAYTVGDRIAILSHRGDVVEYNVLTTTLREVNPTRASNHYTGQTVTIPNSLLLRHPVINESTHGAFILHAFSVPLVPDVDWQAAEKALEAAANEAVEEFIEAARKSWRQLAQAEMHPSQVEPTVTIRVADLGQLLLTVTLVAPIGRQVEIEQQVVRQFLAEFSPRSGGVAAHPGMM